MVIKLCVLVAVRVLPDCLFVMRNIGPAQIPIAVRNPRPIPVRPRALTRRLAKAKHPGRPLAVDDGQVVEAILGHQGTAASIGVRAETATAQRSSTRGRAPRSGGRVWGGKTLITQPEMADLQVKRNFSAPIRSAF